MKYILLISLLVLVAVGCNSNNDDNHESTSSHAAHSEDEVITVQLTTSQIKALALKTGPLPKRNISASIQANGVLEVPPQSHAIVTAIIGANVSSIQVIEGDKVSRGQTLAYLSHPSLIDMQSEYISSYNKLAFLKNEFKRQEELYKEKIGSGQNFQKADSEFKAMKGIVDGYESKLRMLNLNVDKVRGGHIYEKVPVPSPITGYINTVDIRTGQYIEPQTSMFEVVDIRQIHADLMVFEKDVSKVREDQTVRFRIETLPGKELTAKIYSVGKAFEQDPKAVHIHARIENKQGILIPGMYITGDILLGEKLSTALPEAAVVRDGERYIAFIVEEHAADAGDEHEGHDHGSHSSKNEDVQVFRPIEVVPVATDKGWVRITLSEELPSNTRFVLNNAYYLIAEMKKGEAEHSH
jgi:membrane fusion protein, heavy metal efflux system